MTTDVTEAKPRTTAPFSARRMQVAQAIADGLTDREIAQLLYMGERTVGTHIREMRWAVGANNRAHLVAIGYEHGWLGNGVGQ